MSKKEVCCNCCERLIHTDDRLYCEVDGSQITRIEIDRREQCSGDFKRIGKKVRL